MRLGRWQTTHQAIALSGASLASPGEVVDGQHRLAAIASLDFPVSICVTFGAPMASKIDFGLRRTLATVTGLHKDDLAACNVIVSSVTGTTPTVTQQELLCEAYPKLGRFKNLAEHVQFITRAPVFAAFVVAQINGTQRAELWFNQLVYNHVDMPQPIRFLRGKLERDFSKMFSALSTKRIPAYAATLRCIAYAQAGETVGKLPLEPIWQNLESYDGEVGEFIRRNLV